MERLPPDAGIDEIKKFFKENDIDIPDAFLTKNGFKKYLAKHAVRQLESFLDSSKRFDDILSSHPKAGSLWNEWKDVRQGASFESQAMARVLEMQLYDIIGNDPVLSNQLNEAMKQMNVSIDDFTTLAKDPDVMEELGKNSRDVLSQFDLDNKKLIDDIKHFTKADEKGTFGKAMEDIEKKMEEMMDFIKQVSRAIQNLLARTFGREA
jgi:thymidylate synthase